MNKFFSSAEDLAGHLHEYFQVYRDSVKLSIASTISRIAAYLMAGLMVLLCFSFFILFGSIGVAYLLGEWLGHLYLGFMLVSVFYFLVALIIWSVKGRLLQFPLMNDMLEQLSKQEDYDD